MKYDGYRLLVAVGGRTARAYTRSGLDWSEKVAGIVEEAATLDVRSALLDGEAVVMDDDGRSSFQGLQGALKGAPGSIDFIAFDLLELDGENLTGLPLTERKAKLRLIIRDGSHRLRYPSTSRATARSCSTTSATPGSRASSRRRRTPATSERARADG